ERLDSVLEYLIGMIENAPSKDVFLTKLDRIKEGFDLFLSNKQYTRSIARRVIDRYGGTYKETSHLVGMKKGTELYRITVSIRIPNFQKSDVLEINNDMFLVISIKSEIVTLMKFNGRSKQKIKLNELNDYKIYRNEDDIKEADVLYRQGNNVYILDPFDFKEKAVVCSERTNRVRVIKVDDEVLAVPSKF
ncbi:MAG: NMD3-related protein, partial [Thermoplasmatales archaeon]